LSLSETQGDSAPLSPCFVPQHELRELKRLLGELSNCCT